jgi:hypothetical protein
MKPFNDEELLKDHGPGLKNERTEIAEIRRRLSILTSREHESTRYRRENDQGTSRTGHCEK